MILNLCASAALLYEIIPSEETGEKKRKKEKKDRKEKKERREKKGMKEKRSKKEKKHRKIGAEAQEVCV